MSALLLLMALVGVSAPSATCAEVFARGLRDVEKVTPDKRARPALEALGACEHLHRLSAAARAAAAQPLAQRSKLLLEASGVSAECASARCVPLPESLGVSRDVLPKIDGGVYSFAAVAHRTLREASLLTPAAERIFLNLILASLLEGEASRTKR